MIEVDRLNLRHLGAMLAVTRTGSISAAAREVHLTQPAITQAIAKLEGLIGQTLFDRRSDGMGATRAAELFAPRIDAALRLVGNRRVTAVQARAFLAVVRAGGYGAASAASGISNASLHRAVADLTLAYGYPLLERRGSGVVPTTRGRQVARRLALARSELAAGLDELAAQFGRETGHLAIGAMPLSRAMLLPRAITRFHAAHPDFRISIHEGSHAELIGPLRDGELDLLVGALRPIRADDDVEQQALFEDRPVVVGRAGHPLAGTEPDLAQLARYPWVIAGHGAPIRAHFEQMFENAGLPLPPVPVQCGSVITIRELLAGTDFLTLLSPDQIVMEVAAERLAVLRQAPADIVRTIGMTRRSAWRPTPLQRLLIAELEAAAQLPHG